MVAGKFGEHEDFVWCQRLTEQVAFLDSALFHDGPFWVSVCTHVSGLCQLCFALLLKTLALDIDATAGKAYRVYQAAFNRTPDTGGLKYWISKMDGGLTLDGVASGFIASQEFKTLYGSAPSTQTFVSKLYSNVLHRAPDVSGYDYWVKLLEQGKISKVVALAQFSESPENQVGVAGAIQDGIWL